ncbi:Ppx/GppA phosphatase family protein [Lampropedia aestuarii]|uniref:Ppx/GppA phosphatase family protein n=1 Tax=Lampropedia aestuarii TaxID=2562762 RepID=UPI002468E874|nr:Ppx/GppA phosphatase family protein [Lampropedia aestuarii]MDH5857287.1 Ppx/GppA phosphatase family protein [Lampropedia aestuarii]
MKNGERLAAVDLGSNSFRLEISIMHNGHLQRVEYLKETVRQGGGLDADSNLSEEAMERGWQCLARFGERLRDFRPSQVSALATQTLREARNRQAFLNKGQQLLGHPIEVISGQEEARLIYQGVTYLLPRNVQEQRLVIDIGGRSTEVIAGTGRVSLEAVSLPFGSVSWSQRFFAEGKLSAKCFAKAEVAANAIIEEHLGRFSLYPRDHVYGASGTMGAVAQALSQLGGEKQIITREGVERLKAMLIEAQHIDNLQFAGLRDDRKPVIGGGISILLALMNMFGMERMQISEGALRQGALLDLVQRDDHDAKRRDIRQNSVASLIQRFGYDRAQGERIASVGQAIWTALNPHGQWSDDDLQTLQWAGQLHEIGVSIAYERFHHHGAYILHYGDCPGFLPSERERLANLIVGHRGKLKKVAAAIEQDASFAYQLMCLRLAVLLCNARKDPQLQALQWALQKDGSVAVSVSRDWTLSHPQSYYLLQEEASTWEKMPIHLSISVD